MVYTTEEKPLKEKKEYSKLTEIPRSGITDEQRLELDNGDCFD